MENKKNNIGIIIIFVVIGLIVLFIPKIYEFIEDKKLPQVENTTKEEVKDENVEDEVLETVHFPKMRNSKYEVNTYYSLDTFTISSMSNNDILYNAFLDIYEGNMTSNGSYGCATNSKQFNVEYIDLRIKNIIGKDTKYTLENFYVYEDNTYQGNWVYDASNSRYIYSGLCTSKKTNTLYYDLEQKISAKYDNKDIIIKYYVGFAKVENGQYTIYSDAKLTNKLDSGTFTTEEDLNKIFEKISDKKKQTYQYTFKNTLCSYNEYCLYEGKWINE